MLQWIKNHPAWFFVIVTSIAAMVTGGRIKAIDGPLSTPASPKGILSLEVAWERDYALSIADFWSATDVPVQSRTISAIAIESIYLDYWFILAYTLCLIAFILATRPLPTNQYYTRWAVAGAVVAGLLDVVENIYMVAFLNDHSVHNWLFALPSTAKWILVILIIGYVLLMSYLKYPRIFLFIKNILRTARLFAASLVVLLLCYLIFASLSVGQDLLMQIAEPPWWHLAVAFGCIVICATFLWYGARLVAYQREADPANKIPLEFLVHGPRLLAFNLLVALQVAIFTLPTINHIGEALVWLLVLAQNAIYAVYSWSLDQNSKSWGWTFALLTTLAFIAIIYSRETGPEPTAHERYLPWIAVALYVVNLLLVRFFYERRQASTAHVAGWLTIWRVKVVEIRSGDVAREQKFLLWFNALAALGVGVYIAAFVWITLADAMGPLAYTILSFGVLAGLSSILSVISIRKKLNLFLLLFVWSLVLGKLYDPYKVRLDYGGGEDARPELKEFVSAWMKERSTEIDNAETYPVYLVIADGGASRSGYWVASVLSDMEDRTKGKFSRHLFCLAGASGGSVGNATFFAQLARPMGNASVLETSQQFLRHDFLTPVLTHWLGSDFYQHIIPLPFLGDRAVALEGAMEHWAKESGIEGFDSPFEHLAKADGKLPMLFINATQVQQGLPAVISNVKLADFTSRVDVVKVAHEKNNSSFDYSTAVAMGARFPFVSPAGSIYRRSFVDGGYFDNTGAGVVHEMMQKLRKKDLFNEDNLMQTRLTKLEFHVIYISNSSLDGTEPEVPHPMVNDLAAPVLTVLGTYGSQTAINNQRLVNFIDDLGGNHSFREVNLFVSRDMPYPMNWVISQYQLDRMNERLDLARTVEIDPILQPISR